ncbi:MAG: TonB-dependent receptor [Bacteroidetes bacterium]|nr:TonB-dependent receptor [Bacteroidota bacterium]MBS1929970.1 TonB-dependent receptor [Bacteroidota bacterium]
MIHGVVTDAKGPLASVSVTVKGSEAGSTTDENGRYSIRAREDAVLIFTSVGYLTQTVSVDKRTEINVVMISDSKSLGEVVVVGYGTSKKATITGSISTVKGDELKAIPTTNFSNSLAGRLPGLVTATRSGEPGNDDAILRIRGANTLGDNSPLIVIDGIANRDMQRLDPADIESVTILKDASAAIYGAEAANGVILITTKRGAAGKPQISVSLNHAISKPTVLPKLADAATYAQMLNEISLYSGGSTVYSPDEIKKFQDGSDPFKYPNTNWVNTVFKPSSNQDYANVSLSGGSEGLKYFVSLGSNYQDGIYRNSATNYSQTDFRSNIDAKISDNIKVSLDVAGRQENRNSPTISRSLIFDFAVTRALPNVVSFYGPGLPGSNFEAGNNPAVISTNATGYDRDKRYYMQSNLKLDINIPWIKGLSITGNASFDKNFLNEKIWRTPWYLYTWDGVTLDANNKPVLTKVKSGYADPNLTQVMADGQMTTLNALINYHTTIAEKHNIKVLLGTEKSVGGLMNLSAYRRYFLSTGLDQMFAGGDLEKDNNGSASQEARLNYFGRFNYDFRSKYMIEILFRYDGSYIFPEDKRFGFFPGISVGWQIGKEKFWVDNLSFINSFKIRASWGQTGNDRITEYQYLSSMGFGTPLVLNGNVLFKTLNELRISNPNVTWEVANQSNIGFDGELMNGKIKISGDYFHNLRSNILAFRNASVPTSTGLTLPMENIGKVVNQGYEFLVSYGDTRKDFSYQVSVNGGFAKNKIKFWDETPGAPDYQKSTGHPMNTNLYYQAIGIYKDQASVDASPHWVGARAGDIQFKDVNGDGQVNGLDKVRDDRSNIPTFTGGMSLNLRYKNIYVSMLFQGATGAVRYDSITHSGAIGNFFQKDAIGRWTPDNIEATKPRTWNGSGAYWTAQANTYWLQNADYLRLKNIEIGYELPKKINKKMGIQSSTLFISGLNLLTFDHLKDFDPETISNISYPLNKVINFGINVKL